MESPECGCEDPECRPDCHCPKCGYLREECDCACSPSSDGVSPVSDAQPLVDPILEAIADDVDPGLSVEEPPLKKKGLVKAPKPDGGSSRTTTRPKPFQKVSESSTPSVLFDSLRGSVSSLRPLVDAISRVTSGTTTSRDLFNLNGTLVQTLSTLKRAEALIKRLSTTCKKRKAVCLEKLGSALAPHQLPLETEPISKNSDSLSDQEPLSKMSRTNTSAPSSNTLDPRSCFEPSTFRPVTRPVRQETLTSSVLGGPARAVQSVKPLIPR